MAASGEGEETFAMGSGRLVAAALLCFLLLPMVGGGAGAWIGGSLGNESVGGWAGVAGVLPLAATLWSRRTGRTLTISPRGIARSRFVGQEAFDWSHVRALHALGDFRDGIEKLVLDLDGGRVWVFDVHDWPVQKIASALERTLVPKLLDRFSRELVAGRSIVLGAPRGWALASLLVAAVAAIVGVALRLALTAGPGADGHRGWVLAIALVFGAGSFVYRRRWRLARDAAVTVDGDGVRRGEVLIAWREISRVTLSEDAIRVESVTASLEVPFVVANYSAFVLLLRARTPAEAWSVTG